MKSKTELIHKSGEITVAVDAFQLSLLVRGCFGGKKVFHEMKSTFCSDKTSSVGPIKHNVNLLELKAVDIVTSTTPCHNDIKSIICIDVFLFWC